MHLARVVRGIRLRVARTLEALHINGIACIKGRQAWEELQKIASQAELVGRTVLEYVQLVLTDVEMPEMDGYVLTKNIKNDSRFAGIPVLMHSSLSSDANRSLGISVGVDEYVPKCEPHRLAEVLGRTIK